MEATQTEAPYVTEWMKFYQSESNDPANPEARYTPRAAMVVEVRPNGFYDVLVVSSRADLRAGCENMERINDCRFYAEPTVLANRLGDGGWDWSKTGNKFICREVPEVVPREDAFAKVGNKGPAAPGVPQAAQPAPTPAQAPVTVPEPAAAPQARTVFPPPPPPEPGQEFPPIRKSTSTMRVNRKPGAPADPTDD